jgi:hypothetical protein
MWPCCVVTNFFIIKPNRRANFTNLFCHETLHVSHSSSAHHQEFIHCTLSYGICHTGLKTAFEKDQDGTAVPSWSCSKTVSKLVWNIPLRSVQWINSWWWADELPETCRVSCPNKFVKLVRLVGVIIKICRETSSWNPVGACLSAHYVSRIIVLWPQHQLEQLKDIKHIPRLRRGNRVSWRH